MRRVTRRTALAMGATVAGLGVTGATTGARQSDGWTFETGDQVRSSPTAVGSTVYVGSQDGSVYALDAATGEQQWSFDARGDQVWSSPNVVGDTVYVGDTGGNVYALTTDGDVVWRTSVDAGVRSSPTVAGATVYVGTSGVGTVYALDSATGEQRWTYDARRGVDASPTVADGRVFVGGPLSGSSKFVALDAGNGRERWEYDPPSVPFVSASSATVADGTAYIGGSNGYLHAVGVATGEQVWRGGTDTAATIISSPTVAGGRVFVGLRADLGSNVFAFDATTGDRVWASSTGSPVQSSPTVVGGLVFVGSNDGTVHGLDTSTGTELRRIEAGGEFSSPTVLDGTLYVGSRNGTVHAVALEESGSSEGSRVALGTLGHTDGWADTAPTVGGTTPADTTPTARRDTPPVSRDTATAAPSGADERPTPRTGTPGTGTPPPRTEPPGTPTPTSRTASPPADDGDGGSGDGGDGGGGDGEDGVDDGGGADGGTSNGGGPGFGVVGALAAAATALELRWRRQRDGE